MSDAPSPNLHAPASAADQRPTGPASALRAVGLRVVGVGANEGSAGRAVFVEVGGSGIMEADSLRIALLAFNDIRDPEDEATEGEGWGRAWLNEHALDAVRQARAAADLLIVMPHWGQEYATVPNARQRAWAQGLVDAGADMVLGTHPHVLQPTEILRAEGRPNTAPSSPTRWATSSSTRASAKRPAGASSCGCSWMARVSRVSRPRRSRS
ncbi:MAG: CapA family protein [Ardenticatenia bacterium]|nr:CapA family protein [Ardenticatenia bacterium]